VIGFKPTYGAVSRQGLLDLSMSLDQIGPLSNDVSGIAMTLDAIIQYDKTDCTSLNQEFENFTEIANLSPEKLAEDMKKMKIGYIREFKDVTDNHINEIIDESIDKIRNIGTEIVELNFDYLDLCLPTYYLISYVEFFSGTRKYDGRKFGHKVEEVCGEEVLRRIELGSYISQQEFSEKYYKKALQARSLIKNELNKLLDGVDLIVGPTVPKLPHKIGESLEPMEMYAYDSLTSMANLAGIPAGSMKAGEYNGIPIGLQFQAKSMEDAKIIKAMSAFESLK
jgi:aspartyl-tRNA(Asn)/glutamyl-tRNA(Gln) amidotransferase subunit A